MFGMAVIGRGKEMGRKTKDTKIYLQQEGAEGRWGARRGTWGNMERTTRDYGSKMTKLAALVSIRVKEGVLFQRENYFS